MAENMVRCGRCHEVFDAAEGSCAKCGTPYQPPTAAPSVSEGMYADRYAGTELVMAPEVTPAVPGRRRNMARFFIGGGALTILLAVAFTVLYELGVVGDANGAHRPVYVVPITPGPSPTDALPPTIAMTLSQLNDPNLSAQISVESHVQVSSRVLGQSQSLIVKFDGQVSKGNQSGTIQAAGVTQEVRLVDGQVFVRTLPSGKWSLAASMPAYRVICPVFGLTSPKDLQLLGQETRGGLLVNHLRSTGWWTPDISRLAMADLSALPIKPDAVTLDLWVTPAGTPVAATFSGTNSATDGTKLLDIEVSYTFSQVGVPRQIVAPGASQSPSYTA